MSGSNCVWLAEGLVERQGVGTSVRPGFAPVRQQNWSQTPAHFPLTHAHNLRFGIICGGLSRCLSSR